MDDNQPHRPLPRLDATVSAHQRRESRPRRRPCLRWGCITLAVIVFLILVALASYDLTRIHLAERLVSSNLAATTITAYLSPIPNDPFTGKPFLSSATENKPYSVGPDKKDDGATIIYDSTNGTFCSGDVWMRIN